MYYMGYGLLILLPLPQLNFWAQYVILSLFDFFLFGSFYPLAMSFHQCPKGNSAWYTFPEQIKAFVALLGISWMDPSGMSCHSDKTALLLS